MRIEKVGDSNRKALCNYANIGKRIQFLYQANLGGRYINYSKISFRIVMTNGDVVWPGG